ncbi:hypothetical protein HU200_056364 [Digitaria exilis]|uniref:Uncharacterized protein n=1 Tax=Digitaria exilis TaxID=1010633 RepID=A0A835E5T7_9POAL|nr:hypothetical protein HU200_056364 [Digitaria exilis]
MERILGLSLVGAGPGNVLGPGMSAGVLESFARGGGRAETKAAGGNSSRGAAGGTGSSAAPVSAGGKKSAAERRSEPEAEGVGGQKGRGGEDANARARLRPALDGTMFWFEAVAPH